ncbi:MAG: LysR substrate-binding domain-containing protein [Candidatus Thiodiazotropha taylori]|nr:LysR substrate-binding domain-containing protein [Candidatus Thiodiazotropha taylori]MCW4226151.1 LysR substrate-binding domain-containing protein [Candidatus Thiodiazotropha endolucinida]MCG7881623.1 LysR substrate-binding domain-containing protein [Candidatus Thiodiazotropha taylori]MCG7887717.1 LysR substrate-binding domain-containing protein [Candidatus Thiodiazotropha taylori]MCG7889102.1 LysR substrate-binding domain-containing protein [Candidatus Thiodiazotropha taylori]
MYRRLTLHQLAIFTVLARHQNMTRAAAELHMTTPALSIQIKQMSEAMGVPLHEQVGKQLYLTDAGLRVEQAARDVLARLEGLSTELAELQGLERGTLKLSIITTVKYFVPRLLGEFCQQHPGIEVALEVINRDQCLTRLSQNMDDLYIMGRVPASLDVEAVPFMQNPLVVIAPTGHPLEGTKRLSAKRLSDEQFIMREQGSGTRLAAERFFEERKMELKTRMTLGSNEAVKQAVAGGLGIAIVSQHTLSLDAASGAYTVLEVKGFPLLRQWYAVYLKRKRLSAVTEAFLQHLINEGESQTKRETNTG